MGQEAATAAAPAPEESAMEVAHEQTAVAATPKEEVRRERSIPRQPSPRSEEAPTGTTNMSRAHNDSTHVSNERLLAAGGSVAGAAFLGGTLGGPVGAVAGAAAAIGLVILTARSKWKEGVRRS